MATLALSFLLLLVAYWAIRKPIYGLMFYFIIRMFIPPSARFVGFSFNTIAMFLFLLCVLPSLLKTYRDADRMTKGYIKCMSIVYGGLFVLTLLGTIIPLTYQWSGLIQNYGTEIIPSFMVMLFLRRSVEYNRFCNVVCLMGLFTALYGVYTYATHTNPLFDIFSTGMVEAHDLDRYTSDRVGLTGMAVGIYDDKIAMSLIVMLLFSFLVVKTNVNRLLLWPTVGLLFLVLFLTSQRSGLFATLFFLFLLFFDKTRPKVRKYMLWIGVVGVIVVVAVDIEVIKNWFLAIIYVFDDKMQAKLGIGGSSSSMRFMQLVNSLDYMGLRNLLQGCGFNFNSYYYTSIYIRELFGLDPDFYGFESFLVSTLISSGIIGVLLWGWGFRRMFKVLCPKFTLYDVAFYLCFLVAILMTNASASFYLFFFLAALNSKEILVRESSSCTE